MPFLWRCTLRIRPLAAPHALGPFSSIRASSGDPVPNDTLMSCVLKYIMIVVYNWQCSKFCSRLSTFTPVSRAAAAAQWPTSATIFHSSVSFRFFFFGCYCCCCVVCTPPVDFNGGFLLTIFSDFNDPSVNPSEALIALQNLLLFYNGNVAYVSGRYRLSRPPFLGTRIDTMN